MGLTNWKGGRVRESDVAPPRIILGEAEIKELNLIVTRKNDLSVLSDAGRISADHAARRRQRRKAKQTAPRQGEKGRG